jgi:sialate O-acetylesterase
MKKLLLLLVALSIVNAQEEMKSKLKMPAIFSNNMVLQQKTEAPVWGQSEPDTKIVVSASWGKKAETVADKNGSWKVKIPTPKYGGPFEMNVVGGNSKISFKNVMIGEVWICSGQSNMEMTLSGWPPKDTIQGSANAIKEANYSGMRFFTVTRFYATEPQTDCIGTWQECTPQTAAQFSATAFFFGRKLNQELNIPVGLINASWGGTPIESWISGKVLGQFEKYKDIFKKIEESKEQIVVLNKWLNTHEIINTTDKPEEERWKNLDFKDADCSLIDFDDSAWSEMKIPQNWENTEIGTFDGVIWFRKRIEIPENWINKNLVVELGPIDDMDATFVNGKKIGGYEGAGFWSTDRIYDIPAELVKDKNLLIAVRALDNQGGGGIYGVPEKLKIHPKDSEEKINLAGTWKYLPVAEYIGGKLFVFGAAGNEYKNRPPLSINISDHTISSLYNGMIAPLLPYSIKGAIWYQGEENTRNPGEYKNLMQLMIENWRHDWNIKDFPFYFTQIAPYDYGTTKSELLREAQFQTLSVPKTGMAVTMDIGNPINIHPANKKDVGERLAIWALAKDFGKKIAYSGPLYKSIKIQKDKAVLSFEYSEGLSIKPRDGKNNFQIADEDKVFYDATVEVKGNKLIVSAPEVKVPAAVRYCWSNIQEGTLFNKAGLPSSSFRTDNWEN